LKLLSRTSVRHVSRNWLKLSGELRVWRRPRLSCAAVRLVVAVGTETRRAHRAPTRET
jgi:hypothetical protein